MAAGSSSGQKTDSLDISMQSDDEYQQVASAPAHYHSINHPDDDPPAKGWEVYL